METRLLRALRRHALTRTLSSAERRYLAELGRVIGYLPGTYVFHESQPRRAFGIILKGSLELRRGQRGRPAVLAVLGPGDSYGEGSLLDDYPHSASAYATGPLEALEIPR
ncbi:MAG: cyclic nucleotide-binding domain-containing protein, partial [Gemmatimonadetes bacterium]|nr:cyclic nucleotide-binding domain-containing protein [Gemmatimonadota bacterium]NIQ56532.1 cyclic nucleotide-binding domain-containing protein [Gemmatimonadota bacterium]NIU76734.1 cyclic nucleotide-binding domain-containing protein [Gammaproteobacteria bacterium]NIX46142.1 cyclic nucleotide-binding domain-containing protein [Gemmatimonadota bacterium]NIY10457.1 cyclic nucleotide-binding domain-containing protein [Gemmatimonadota bacterium]